MLLGIRKYTRLFIKISRFDNIKPALLLFFPCLWGLFLGYNEHLSRYAMIKAVFIFFIGSVAARSFGCIINDIIDKDIDAKVERTKNRPLANGDLKVWQAVIMAFVWLCVCFYCFLFFNNVTRYTIILGLIIAIFYPFSKRFVKIPQYVLGFGFNLGVLIGFSAIYRDFSNIAMVFYASGIYWTLFYDTIYAMQDIEDDKKIGVNSSAIYYGDHVFRQLGKYAIMMVGCNIFAGIWISAPWFYYIFSLFILVFLGKLLIMSCQKERNYQKIFELNGWVGLIVAIQILLTKIYG